MLFRSLAGGLFTLLGIITLVSVMHQESVITNHEKPITFSIPELVTASSQTTEIVQKLNHKETELSTKTERAFLRRLDGGCQIPIGANAKLVNGKVFLEGMIASLNGKILLRDSANGKIEDAESLGILLAEMLLAKGGDKILDEIRK